MPLSRVKSLTPNNPTFKMAPTTVKPIVTKTLKKILTQTSLL